MSEEEPTPEGEDALAVPTPEQEPEQAPAESAEPIAAAAEGEVSEEVPAGFDWSYKLKDEIKEVPEDYRFSDEAEKAEKIKDLYQKSEGLEWHKQQSTQMTEKLSGYETQLKEYEPVIDQVKQLNEWYAKGDDMRVMESLGYDKDRILKMAKEIIDLDQMPQEQRQQYERNRNMTIEKEQTLQENEQIRQQLSNQQAQMLGMQLDQELSRADVQSLAAVYDGEHGAGKFREFVVAQGYALTQNAGRVVPPSELIPHVVGMFKPFQAQASEIAQTTPPEQAAPKPKVIPNVKGSGRSVGKSSITSIADLKRIRQEKFGA